MYNDEFWGRSGPQAIVDITELSKGKRIAAVDEIKRALEIADVIPFRYAIQHIGVSGQEFDERRYESAFSSLEELKVFAGQRGVQLLIENTPNQLSSAERLNYFMRETHLDLGYCFDIGHAHMTGRMEEQFELMQPSVRSVHIHDNHGEEDEHCFPQEGTIDWRKAMKRLRSLGAGAALVLELKEPPGMEQPIPEAMRCFEKLQEIRTDE